MKDLNDYFDPKCDPAFRRALVNSMVTERQKLVDDADRGKFAPFESKLPAYGYYLRKIDILTTRLEAMGYDKPPTHRFLTAEREFFNEGRYMNSNNMYLILLLILIALVYYYFYYNDTTTL